MKYARQHTLTAYYQGPNKGGLAYTELQNKNRIEQLEDMIHMSLRRQQSVSETQYRAEEEQARKSLASSTDVLAIGSTIIPGQVVEVNGEGNQQSGWNPHTLGSRILRDSERSDRMI